MKAVSSAPTSTPPKTVGGVVWRCYHVGVGSYQWRTEAGHAVGSFSRNLRTFWARAADGKIILSDGRPGRSKRFRSQSAAMLAALDGRK